MYNSNGDTMRKLISLLFICLIGYLGYTYRTEITEYILKKLVNDSMIVTYEDNLYAKSNTEEYQSTDNFYPQKKEDIINIFFTALNGGWENVTFFCTKSYENCLDDVSLLVNNSTDFTKVNNYVHPYNSYKRLILNYNTFGKITITIEKLYSKEEISLIDNKVDEIMRDIITNDMDMKSKIKTVHDYIINHTTYDEKSAEKVKNHEKVIDFISHKANGALIDGKAICGGYSDAMAIFLDKLKIKNYKLFSDMHVWNYVFFDDDWYHLDLTWDDPVTDTGENILLHSFFLITDEELKKLDAKEHNYY